MLVRSETGDDWNAVYALNAVAFETPAEANLVNSLRKQVAQVISHLREADLQSKGVNAGQSSHGDILKQLLFKIMH